MEYAKLVVIGATSSIAQHCCRLWAGRVAEIVLVGRSAEALAPIAADLRVRAPACQVRTVVGEFLAPDGIARTVDETLNGGPADLVLIAHGMLPDQATCQTTLAACANALQVNGLSPVLFAEAYASGMARAGQGRIAVIGSVAGDRGRRSNYVYGAAKGLVSRYLEGLQHRFAGTGVRVVLIKPGPTDTPMTAELKQKGARLASVGSVAERIVSAVERGDRVVYAPAKWRLIMWVIRHLPPFVFNRLSI